nr:PREDICTED: uncharacterized protein LOC107982635 [Anolis carolinensis]|eukprot:XP_016847830.1 PREDICTED: uncharacterized protein LOC107982635 [Anolis carolinensis]
METYGKQRSTDLSHLCDLLGKSICLILQHLKTVNKKLDLLFSAMSLTIKHPIQTFSSQNEEDDVFSCLTEGLSQSDGEGEGKEKGPELQDKKRDVDLEPPWERGNEEGSYCDENLFGKKYRQSTGDPLYKESTNISPTQLGQEPDSLLQQHQLLQFNKLVFEVVDSQLNRGRWCSQRAVKRSLGQILSKHPMKFKINTMNWLHREYQCKDHTLRLLITFEDHSIIEEVLAHNVRLNHWGIYIRRVLYDPVVRPLLTGLRPAPQIKTSLNITPRSSIPTSSLASLESSSEISYKAPVTPHLAHVPIQENCCINFYTHPLFSSPSNISIDSPLFPSHETPLLGISQVGLSHDLLGLKS